MHRRMLLNAEVYSGNQHHAMSELHGPPLGQEGTTYLELVVDGDIVDLNRIPLPADTPINDERFKDAKNK